MNLTYLPDVVSVGSGLLIHLIKSIFNSYFLKAFNVKLIYFSFTSSCKKVESRSFWATDSCSESNGLLLHGRED